MVSTKQLKQHINKLLDGADLSVYSTLTAKKVRRNLEEKLGLDENSLDTQKDEISEIVTEWVNSQKESKEEEEEQPKAEGAKKKKRASSDDEDVKPQKKKARTQTKKTKKANSDSEEEASDSKSKKTPKKKAQKKKKKRNDSGSEESEEEEKKPKKKVATPKKKTEETEGEKKIKELKNLVKLCGLRLLGLRGLSEDETIAALKKILRDNGLTGNVTPQQAKKFGKEYAKKKELEELAVRPSFTTSLPRSARSTRGQTNYHLKDAFADLDKVLEEETGEAQFQSDESGSEHDGSDHESGSETENAKPTKKGGKKGAKKTKVSDDESGSDSDEAPKAAKKSKKTKKPEPKEEPRDASEEEAEEAKETKEAPTKEDSNSESDVVVNFNKKSKRIVSDDEDAE